jgi:hypothetical protein
MTCQGVWYIEPWESFLLVDRERPGRQSWDELELKDGGWYCAMHAYCNVSGRAAGHLLQVPADDGATSF